MQLFPCNICTNILICFFTLQRKNFNKCLYFYFQRIKALLYLWMTSIRYSSYLNWACSKLLLLLRLRYTLDKEDAKKDHLNLLILPWTKGTKELQYKYLMRMLLYFFVEHVLEMALALGLFMYPCCWKLANSRDVRWPWVCSYVGKQQI